jgi:tetratricopeptide (TPR) repeat protein
MNHRLTCSVFLTLTLAGFSFAQGGKPTGGRGPSTMPGLTTPGTQPPMNSPDPNYGRQAFLTGTVVLDDGSPLTESASIHTLCRGRKQTVAHTDSHGAFSFQLGDRVGAAAESVGDADISSMGNPNRSGSAIQRDWRDCELMAELPGFTSQSIELSSRLSTLESADLGRLVLHRVGKVEGLTISATSAMAPKNAQKAYEKGSQKAGKQKWDEAQQLFNQAVTIYPKYALAWFDLGRIQFRNNEPSPARHSFEQSIAADSKYVNPYRGLAELDVSQQNWADLVTVTSQLLALDPVSFPDAWLRNSIGNYYLHNLADAEKSARQGMKIDDQHKVPKLEYLLGVILIQKHEYQEAASHIETYLKVATQPSDIADAQKQLAEITRLQASAGDPPAEKK